MFVTSIVEGGRDFDSEGEDTPDYLDRKIVIGKGDRRDARSRRDKPTSTLRINQCKRGRLVLLEVWRGRKSATWTTPFSLRNFV